MGKILVVGSVNMDLLFDVDTFPETGETVLANSYQQLLGGKGANQAMAAKRAGVETVLVCRPGSDSFGKEITAQLQQEDLLAPGCDASSSAGTGLGMVVKDQNGDNQIITTGGGNQELHWEHAQPFVESLQPEDLVMLQLEIPLQTNMDVAKCAREKGATVMLNPAPAIALSKLRPLLQYVTVLLPNEIEVSQLMQCQIETNEHRQNAAQVLMNLGPEVVIVTLGAAGAQWYRESQCQYQPAVQIGKAIDTVGAGDAFCGNYAAEWSRTKNEAKALLYAATAAGICVTQKGAFASMPERSKVLAAMQH